MLPLPNSQILIITNSHFSFQQIITTNKILEIYIVISLLKLPSFVCYKRLGCLMHSHIPTPQKKFKSHTHIRKPMSSGWSSSFQVSCHTHTHVIVFFLILFTLKVSWFFLSLNSNISKVELLFSPSFTDFFFLPTCKLL